MAGILVLVIGPSGAGKDTLIGAAKHVFAGDQQVVFPRRMVTRDAVRELEDHDTMSWEAFAAGGFALSWEAHGLGYALPRRIEADLAAGRTVVVNVSRNVIAEAAGRYRCGIILIAAHPLVRAARLTGRGRESVEDIAARLAREGAEVPTDLAPLVTVDNSGPLEPSVSAFVAAVQRFSRSE